MGTRVCTVIPDNVRGADRALVLPLFGVMASASGKQSTVVCVISGKNRPRKHPFSRCRSRSDVHIGRLLTVFTAKRLEFSAENPLFHIFFHRCDKFCGII